MALKYLVFTCFFVVLGVWLTPVYTSYYIRSHVADEIVHAQMEAQKIKIISAALKENAIYIDYLNAKSRSQVD